MPADNRQKGKTMTPRLYRSRRHRMIAGVCGGLAERYDWDPSTVRLVFVLLMFVPIPTHIALLYIIMWIVVPEAPE
jgi:phage shock protein C